MYQTIFPASEENEEVIRILVQQMGFLAGKSVLVERQIVASTDDINIASALDSLADSVKARNNDKDEPKKSKKGKKAEEHDPISMGRASWRAYDGEIISTMKLHQRLAAGEFPNNMTFANFKGELWVVLDNKLIKEPQA
jgi:hypothetical protein